MFTFRRQEVVSQYLISLMTYDRSAEFVNILSKKYVSKFLYHINFQSKRKQFYDDVIEYFETDYKRHLRG